jgi:hypothetical protein
LLDDVSPGRLCAKDREKKNCAGNYDAHNCTQRAHNLDHVKLHGDSCRRLVACDVAIDGLPARLGNYPFGLLAGANKSLADADN